MSAQRSDLWRVLEGHRASVLRAVRPYCADPSDAEDCVHDAFVQVAECNGLDLDRVGGLLRTIAIRRAIDLHRSSASQRRAVHRLGADAHAATAPDVVVIERQQATRLAAVAKALPVGQRRVLAARVEGYKPRETAALLGVPAKSIHLALSRARTTLKAAIAATPVLVGGWLGLRALRRAIRVAPATALAVTGVVVLMVNFTAPTSPIARTPGDTPARIARVAATDLPGTRPQRPSLVGAARFVPLAPARSRAAAPPATPMLRAGNVAAVGFAMDRRQVNQTLLQSVQACLSSGIVVDANHAGCNAAFGH